MSGNSLKALIPKAGFKLRTFYYVSPPPYGANNRPVAPISV